MKKDRYNLTYREAEVSQVMRWIKAGESGCIVGLRGAGKSNFLRFMLRKDVQQHYLKPDDAKYTFTLINLLMLPDVTERAVYGLVLERLIDQLRSVRLEDKLAEIDLAHRKVTDDQDNVVLIQRAIEQCLARLCQAPEQRVILLFDEFDDVFQKCNPSLFRFLRAMRDAYKSHISYLVIVTHDLAYLRDNLTDVDHFFRLVSRNVCGLGPYSQDDARQMLHYLATKRAITLTKGDSAYLIEQSGGHAGLLKSILSQIWDLPQGSKLQEFVPLLQREPVVQAECQKAWHNLSEVEQITLHNLVAGQAIDPGTFQRLKRKGLIREDKTMPYTFSPVFADFIRQQTPPSTTYTIVSRSPRQVQLEGRIINNLTELEFDLLCYLYENRGRVCTKNDLIATIYRQQYDTQGGADDMLQQLISRLRKKIKPDRNQPGYIVTVRREGYKFVEPNKL